MSMGMPEAGQPEGVKGGRVAGRNSQPGWRLPVRTATYPGRRVHSFPPGDKKTSFSFLRVPLS